MPWPETAAIVAQPYVVSRFRKPKCKTVIVVAAVCSGRLQQAMDHQNRILLLTVWIRSLRLRKRRIARLSPGEKFGRSSLVVLGRDWLILSWIVDMPQINDKPVLRLHIKHLRIQTNSSRIIPYIGHKRIRAALGRDVLGIRFERFLDRRRLCSSGVLPLDPSVFGSFPGFRALLLFLPERTAHVRILQKETAPDSAPYFRDTGEDSTGDDSQEEAEGSNRTGETEEPAVQSPHHRRWTVHW